MSPLVRALDRTLSAIDDEIAHTPTYPKLERQLRQRISDLQRMTRRLRATRPPKRVADDHSLLANQVNLLARVVPALRAGAHKRDPYFLENTTRAVIQTGVGRRLKRAVDAIRAKGYPIGRVSYSGKFVG
jgi:hypothetical protein